MAITTAPDDPFGAICGEEIVGTERFTDDGDHGMFSTGSVTALKTESGRLVYPIGDTEGNNAGNWLMDPSSLVGGQIDEIRGFERTTTPAKLVVTDADGDTYAIDASGLGGGAATFSVSEPIDADERPDDADEVPTPIEAMHMIAEEDMDREAAAELQHRARLSHNDYVHYSFT